ncbi:hypothetical protein [Microvirga alba]|uniref:Uncharacterized protein n=1 Tax=Microvirga alba TaxID=2791025 RepID=A0A931FN67_9HYPH|nr:hypothetical protein [Microvirga alba]MBF9231997.1 hypothetical protein [Microvirga alba]
MKSAFAAIVMVGGLAFAGAVLPARATPFGPDPSIAKEAGNLVTQARWVCGPYRCWWRGPRYYHRYRYHHPYRYYHRYRYYRPYRYYYPRGYYYSRGYWPLCVGICL